MSHGLARREALPQSGPGPFGRDRSHDRHVEGAGRDPARPREVVQRGAARGQSGIGAVHHPVWIGHP
eukprot:10475853-Alexandrium_andersonii.AAC.1